MDKRGQTSQINKMKISQIGGGRMAVKTSKKQKEKRNKKERYKKSIKKVQQNGGDKQMKIIRVRLL